MNHESLAACRHDADPQPSLPIQQERDLGLWKKARVAYKGVKDPAGLVSEMPSTHIGVLLLTFIRQVRKVGRKAAVHRAQAATCAGLSSQLEEKKAALAELERLKAEAEAEAARIAAEEEAARIAAEEEAARIAAEEEAARAAAEGGGEAEATLAAEGEPAAEGDAPAE